MNTPKLFIIVLASFLLVTVSVQLYAQGQPDLITVTGEASVEVADNFETGEATYRYFITSLQPKTGTSTQVSSTSNKKKLSRVRTEIFFQGKANEQFRTGKQLRVHGRRHSNGRDVNFVSVEALEPEPEPDPGGEPEPGDGDAPGANESAPLTEAPVATAETRKILTILISFNDADVTAGANAPSLQDVKNIMFHDAQNVSHFYDLASLGTLTIPSDPNDTGGDAVYGPYTVNFDYLGGDSDLCDVDAWQDAALTAWEADTGYDRSDYRHHSFIVPNYWDNSNRNCGWGGYANVGCGTSCWAFSADPVSILHGVIVHELGHNFTLGHARTDPNNDGITDVEYGDSSDMMGGSRNWMKFNPPHFEYVDWYDQVSYELQSITPGSTLQSFDLIPIDEEDTDWSGLRSLKTSRDGSTSYYLSYRQQTGHYNEVTSSYTTGVSLHWRYNTGNAGYASHFIRIIEPGEVFVDPAAGLLVRGVGSMPIDDGLGNTTNVFTVEVCNETCDTLMPVINLVAQGAFPDTIRLSWEDFSYNEDGFEIEHSPDGVNWSGLTTTAADTDVFLHSGLTGNSTVFYRVRAFRGASETSDWSNIASATTPQISGLLGFPIIHGDDDVEQMSSDGDMYFTSSDIDLGLDSWAQEQHHEGLRFQNVIVPQGATVNSAYIRYRSTSNGTGSSPVTIRIEDSADAPPFGSTDYYLDGLTFSTTTVPWTLGDWTSLAYFDTPDLTALVQPIINKTGWVGGNAMAFVNQGTQTGTHAAYSFDSTSGNKVPATLYIDYTWVPTGNQSPSAAYTFSCTALDCSFTDTSIDSDGTIASWDWDFGDAGSSSTQSPAYSFAAPGIYSVSLTVTDDGGATNTVSQDVTVPTVTRGPYLQTLTEDSVIVRWRTDGNTDNSVVRFGLTPGTLTTTASTAGSTDEHAVELTGLSPSTEYFYSIGDSGATLMGDSSFHFKTSPVPGTSVSTRFWVLGDSGTADANARAVRDSYKSFVAASNPSDFMLMLGDNAYNDGTDEEYQAAVFETYPELLRQLPLWPTLGNHDGYTADSDSQTGPYYDIFDLPTNGEAGGLSSGTEAYYAFDYGDIHFIVLDSYETDRSAGGSMMTWLESDLVSNDKPWVIAFWHHPPYTKGSHNSDTEGQLIDMRQNAVPLLESWGVDLVLCGHSHSYERSMLLDGHYGVSTTLDVPTMVLDVGDGSESGFGAYEKPSIIAAQNAGSVYAVAGSSGKTSGGSLNHPVMYISLNVLGSMVIDVDDDRLDAVFLDNVGAIRDEFTILKTIDITPPQFLDASPEDATHVLLNFDERLESTSAETTTNYSINGLSVSTAQLLPGSKTVRLTVSTMTDYAYYVVTINNVENESGISIAANSQAAFYFILPTTVEFQSDMFDASFREDSPTTNYGSAQFLEVDGDTPKYALIGWDLSSVPGNAVIQSASIHLTVFDVSTGSFTCNAMTRPWVESEVTWNNASSGVPWATPGATGATDRNSDILCDSFGAGSLGPLTIELNSLGIAQVQSWVDGTDPTNFGFMLGNPTSTNGADFRSSEYGIATERPSLEVTYVFPIPVPNAPTGLGATAVSQTQINLGWTDNSVNETGFKVERSLNGSTGWTTIANPGPNNTIYADTGRNPQTTYYYRVFAHNDSGDSGFSNVANATTIAPSNVAPTASFSYSCNNLVCTFSDLSTDSDGSIVSWQWDFGDGNTSDLQNPEHQFLAANTYTVTLTVTDDAADIDNTSDVITVSTPKLWGGVVGSVSSSAWTTVTLPQNYVSMVVVASPNYQGNDDPAVVRIDNVTASSFDVRVSNPSGASISGIPVHYLVVEEGVYTTAANSISMEAVKFTSTITDDDDSWVGESRSYINAYTSPVVLGQVMSYNDADWSVFWARGGTAGSPPSASTLFVGKHVAEDSDTTRGNETIGYLVIESGSGSIEDIQFTAALGNGSIQGVGNSPPYNYSTSSLPIPGVAVVSSAAMDGADGGWPILYGGDPVTATQISLAIDEDQIADTERSHAAEQVAYMVLDVSPCSASRPLPANQWVGISLPCAPSDAKVRSVFSDGPSAGDYDSRWVMFHYDASTPGWVRMTVDDALVEGKGYLYYSLDAFASVGVSGQFNTGSPIPLAKAIEGEAWNFIGNPNNQPVDWTSISVDDGTTTYSWSEMDQQIDTDPYYCEQTPNVAPGCMMWHVMHKWEANVYVPYDGQGATPGTLGVFETMWVRSHRADSILVPNPAVAPPAAMMTAPELTEGASIEGMAKSKTARKSKWGSREWDVRLIVESGPYRDDGNWLGQMKKARDGLDTRDLEEWTPFGNPYLSLLFTNPLFAEVDWGYTRDYREVTGKQTGEWSFVIRASSGITEATLSWQGDAALFRKATLVDEVSGKTIKVKPGENYTFDVEEDEHRFRMIFQ